MLGFCRVRLGQLRGVRGLGLGLVRGLVTVSVSTGVGLGFIPG